MLEKLRKYFQKLLFSLNIRLTLSFPMFPFDPPENIRKHKVFQCFQGCQEKLVRKSFNTFLTMFYST